MSEGTAFYITTPIYYVNGSPHIGTSYTSIACDVMARFKRLDGYDVQFLTGTDEHGQKVAQTAEKNGMSPQEFADKVAEDFMQMGRDLNFTNDYFIRTTQGDHKKAATAFWKKMMEGGDIYLDKYAGWYSVRDEAFYAEDETELRDDGQRYAVDSGTEVEWVEEESYFFKLSAYEDKLLEWYDSHPECVMPKSRLNEVRSFVSGGLKDLSISRTTFDWGIPVPNDPKHVMYVWVDALSNYISYLGYPNTNGENYSKYWPADFHVIGKDILRFHAVYWPAFLMSAGLELPKTIFAHGWWTVEGQKMSKSTGNVIAPKDLVDNYGLDQSRYFLLREVPFGNDGDFSRSALIQRNNSDLANNLGNLVQRTLSMIFKNCDGQIPGASTFSDADQKMLDQAYALLEQQREFLDVMAFNRALESIWFVVGEANAYVDEQAPWALKKTDPERMATVLYVLAEVIRNVALLLQPYMPDSASKILDMLVIGEGERDFKHFGKEHMLATAIPIEKPEGVFPRIQDEEGEENAA
jgi:methionyl-tRNA synthetase